MDNSKRMTQKYVKLKYGALVCTLILFIRIAWLWSSPGYDTLALRSSKNANRKDNSARVCLPASNDIALSATGSSEIGSALQRGAKTCTSVGSAEPIAWGPVAWNLLHTMAANFSDKPDMAHIDHCKTFFVSLPYMLPCGDCGYHLKEYLKDIDLDLACSSRIRLRSFIVKMYVFILKLFIFSPYESQKVFLGYLINFKFDIFFTIHA